MLVTELRVQLRESLILGPPRVDLLLEGADLVVLACYLLPKISLKVVKLALEGLDTLVVLLEHQLVSLVLRTRIEVFLLKLRQPALGLPLRLLRPESVLFALLLLLQSPLLLLKITLCL